VEVEAADWGILMNSGNNEMMKQGSCFWAAALRIIVLYSDLKSPTLDWVPLSWCSAF